MKSLVLLRALLLDWVRNGSNLLICLLFLVSAVYLGAVGLTFASDGLPGLSGYFVPGLMAVFVMVNGLVILPRGLTEMKGSGLLERIAATSVSKSVWLLCLMSVQIVASLVLCALALLVGILPFGAPLRFSAFWPLLIVMGCVLFSGLGTLVANLAERRFSPSKVSIAVAFLMALFSGSFWPPAGSMYLQDLSLVLPLTYLESGLRASTSTGDLSTATFDAVVIAFLGVAFFGLAWASTKWD